MLDGKSIGGLTGFIGANLAQWNAAMAKVNADLKAFTAQGIAATRAVNTAFASASTTMTAAGKKMTMGLSLPLAAISALSGKAAADFETSFAKIAGLVGVPREQLEGMKQAVLDLGGSTGQAPAKLADALFFITSAGLRGQEAIDVLNQSARAATAGLGEVSVVADLVTSAVNAYGSEALSAGMATDILTNAVRQGKAEASELAGSMGQVLPIASELGVSFDQVGAAIAAMTRTGTNAANAGTQLKAILNGLLKPAQNAEDALADMGTSSANLRKQLREEGLVSVLSWLRKEAEKNETAFAQVFPNIRALSGALDIMGANAESNVEIFKALENSTGVLDEAFGEVADTTRFKLNQYLAEFQAEAIKLGTMLLPAINKGIEALRNMITWWKTLSKQTKENIIKIGAALALLGPMMTAAGKVVGLLALAFSPLFLKMLVLGTAFAAGVVAGQWFVDNWGKLVSKVSMFNQTMVLSFQKMQLAILHDLKDFMGHLLNQTPVGLFMSLFGVNAEEFAAQKTGLQSVIDTYTFAIAKGQQKLSQTIQDDGKVAFTSLVDSAKNAVDQITDLMGTMLDNVSAKFDEMLNLGAFAPTATSTGGGETERTPMPVMPTKGAIQLTEAMKNLRVSSDTALDGMAIKLRKVQTTGVPAMVDTAAKVNALGQALQTSLSSSLTDFATTLGNAFTGDAGAQGFFDNLLLIVADFGLQFGKSLIAAGVAALAFKKLLLNPIGAIIAGTALVASMTAVKNLLQRGPGGNETSVNDALITSDGKVVKFHPDDNILAMKDFGALTAGMAMTKSPGRGVPIVLKLDSRTVWKGMADYQEKERR